MPVQREIVLVTGASSGIGATYARKLASQGYDLILVARRSDRLDALSAELKALYDTNVTNVVADLSTNDGVTAIEAVLADTTAVTMLVNNAGTAGLGTTDALPAADITNMLDLNITALTRLSRAAVVAFKARNKGTIVNLASAVSVAAMPVTSVYSGTKAYVLLFSLGLQQELQGTAVKVQVVLPAAVATEIYDGSIMPLEQIPPALVMTADDMVEAALSGLAMGETVTWPSVPDLALWDQYQFAAAALFNATQSGRSADRYTV
jgi:short-subunit dehydrogenase